MSDEQFEKWWSETDTGMPFPRSGSDLEEWCRQAFAAGRADGIAWAERATAERDVDRTSVKYDQLYLAANRLMVIIGAVGSVDSRHDAVSAVMDALHDIDGGVPPNP